MKEFLKNNWLCVVLIGITFIVGVVSLLLAAITEIPVGVMVFLIILGISMIFLSGAATAVYYMLNKFTGLANNEKCNL